MLTTTGERLVCGCSKSLDTRLCNDGTAATLLADEGEYDIIVVALHGLPEKALEYSNQLTRDKPGLPILLLADSELFIPPGTLIQSIQSGNPANLIRQIALMLAGRH